MNTQAVTASLEADIIALQTGRILRRPFRVVATCVHGFPMAVVSPSLLEDGDRFPTYSWLTCPWLVEVASSEESRGGISEWTGRAAADPVLRKALESADERLKAMRAAESGGEDACPAAGVAGRTAGASVKCLHARIAAVLAGVDDPIGTALIRELPPACPDGRCRRLGEPT